MIARRGRDRIGGFTLVETLVALVVFAVVAVVAQRGIVTTWLGLDRARSTLAAEQVARSIIETDLDRLARGPGSVSGESGGIAWTVAAEPIALPLPASAAASRSAPPNGSAAQNQPADERGQRESAPPPAEPDVKWRLLRVVVSVANGRGRPLAVETVHAVKDVP